MKRAAGKGDPNHAIDIPARAILALCSTVFAHRSGLITVGSQMYKNASRNRQPRIAGESSVPGTAAWMRRQSEQQQKAKIHRQVAAQMRRQDERVRLHNARRSFVSAGPAGPELRKQPPREANREGLVASQAPTVSVPPLAGESQSAQKTTA